MQYRFPLTVSIVSWERLGDVDLNGKIDSVDACIVLQEAIRLLSNPDAPTSFAPIQFRFADADDDGKLTANDAQSILMFYLTKTLSNSGKTSAQVWNDILK